MARFAAIFSIISSCAALSYKACTGHNKDHLYQEAANISARADELLVPSQFARVVDGHLVLIRDEEDGKEDGGRYENSLIFHVRSFQRSYSK